MNDQPIRVTHTNSAEEFSGLILGIETPLFRWIAAALVVGFVIFALLYYAAHVSLLRAGSIGLLPSVLSVSFLVFLFQGKPPSYASDLLESIVNHGDAAPASRRCV